jgi:nitrate reductase beta subunit
MGVLLYDQDLITTAAAAPDDELLRAQLDAILDPWDDRVVAAAEAAGIDQGWIDAARRSPAWKFVKEWGLALPLHPEFRTVAMMFYIPPLSPVVSTIERNLTRLDLPAERVDFELFEELDKARLPVEYLANLFSNGDVEVIRAVLRKMLAVRIYKRRQSVEGEIDEATLALLASAGTSPAEAEDIYRLTTLPTVEERFVLPPYHREMSLEELDDPLRHKGEAGLGYLELPRRGA